MKNESIKVILDFTEGRMTVEEFWNVYSTNSDLRQEMIEDLNKNMHSNAQFDPIDFLYNGFNIQFFSATLNLHGIAKRILKHNNISFVPTDFYRARYEFLLDIQPDWLDLTCNNEPFLIDLVASAPKELSKAQKLKWCKGKLLELFKYDSKPPRWVQSADWPIKRGKPLVFRAQSKERTESELVKYFFYDPETGEEVEIRQYY